MSRSIARISPSRFGVPQRRRNLHSVNLMKWTLSWQGYLQLSGNSDMAEHLAEFSTSTERIVSRIWAGQFPLQRIRPDSDFFSLGGDSLLMLEMLFQVSQELGLDVSPGILFEEPTLRGFCFRFDTERDRC